MSTDLLAKFVEGRVEAVLVILPRPSPEELQGWARAQWLRGRAEEIAEFLRAALGETVADIVGEMLVAKGISGNLTSSDPD